MSNGLQQIVDQIGQVLLGKEHTIKLAVACLVARGHLLIEDLPGMGKTTLAQALAAITGLDYRRVQFTSDMLPADLTGFSMFNSNTQEFEFQSGPVFCQFLLADEINRSSPKTQSALLEAMEEGIVSVDGVSRPLPDLFFVIATQNPHSLAGTFPLPESQLDRFLMRVSIGYPSELTERKILSGENPRDQIEKLKQLLPAEKLLDIQKSLPEIDMSEVVIAYVQRLLTATREGTHFVHGVSPRGGMALIKTARAWAMLHDRGYMTPDDVQAVVASVFAHRLNLRSSGAQASIAEVDHWVESIDIL